MRIICCAYLFHEERGLDVGVASLHQKLGSPTDQGLVQKLAISLQEISSMTGDFTASFGVITINHG